MSTDANKKSREQLEVRVVAMLLGEASAFESAELQEILAKDAELAAFHDRMKRTMGLIEDASKPVPVETKSSTEQPKLSAERRDVLFTFFRQAKGKVVPMPEPEEIETEEMRRKRKKQQFRRLMEWGIAACIILILAGTLLPALSKAKSKARRISTMASRSIEGGKDQWAYEPQSAAAPAVAALDISADAISPADRAPIKVFLPSKGTERIESLGGLESLATKDDVAVITESRGASVPGQSADQTRFYRFQQAYGDKNDFNFNESRPDGLARSSSPSPEEVEKRGRANTVTELATTLGDRISGNALHDSKSSVRGFYDDGFALTPSTPADGTQRVVTGEDLSDNFFGGSKLDADPERRPAATPSLSPGTTDYALGISNQSPALSAPENESVGGIRRQIDAHGFGAVALDAAVPPSAESAVKSTLGRSKIKKENSEWFDTSKNSPSFDNRFAKGNAGVVLPETKSVEFERAKEKAVALQLSTGLPSQNIPTETLVQNGKLLYEMGKLDEADKKLEEALAQDPSNKAAKYYADLSKERLVARDSSNSNKNSRGAMVVAGSGKQIRDAELEGKLRAAKLDSKVAHIDELQESIEQDLPRKKPVTPPATPQPEISTRDNAFSTFSLNVSDVSFKLAAASLQNNVIPDAGSIRVEEFINAFNYHDPAPAPGARLAFAWERARYPFAHNRDVLRLAVQTAARGRDAQKPLNLVILLDNSGSMERPDRVAILHEALKVLAQQLRPQDRISIVAFSRTAQLQVDGMSGGDAKTLLGKVLNLNPDGGTNLEEAMNLGYETARRHFVAHGVNRVIVLTDGAANLGNVEPEDLKKKVVAERQKGIALDCFGIGWEGFNDDLLETLSRNGDGRYGFLNKPEQAGPEFANQLAGALNVAASDVKTQVEFNPKRVMSWRQIGYAKHQLTKEQFRDNTVDAAEIAAAEQGNALYVIETNPQGSGPIGTVRVRFKVPETGEYVEQEWPLEYQPRAATLDQASPATRLAVTASAFGEWLSTSPFAAEVTLPALQSFLSGVPETFSPDPRPQQLGTMIRQAQVISGK